VPPTIKVKSADEVVRKQRESTAERVVVHFGNSLPALPLLCFFDDEDWQALKVEEGVANRGFYSPIRPGGLWWPPDYLAECFFVDGRLAFEHLIYLHGSTCSSELGQTMTFAHELQHFIQYSTMRQVWAANRLAYAALRCMEPRQFKTSGLRACDIPHERQARIVAKGAAESLFGANIVNQYIEAKRTERVTEQDAADWECIRGFVASTPYDLAAETKLFFQRLKPYRPELERSLRDFHGDDPDIKEVDLDALLSGPV
jgi:hypothetical protein